MGRTPPALRITGRKRAARGGVLQSGASPGEPGRVEKGEDAGPYAEGRST